MKLSDFKGEAALDALADLIEPVADVAGDKEVVDYVRSKQYILAVKSAIKNHKRSVITILAVLDGADPETYKPGLTTLPAKLLEILNDPELTDLFFSQEQTEVQTISGSATGSIEGEDQ